MKLLAFVAVAVALGSCSSFDQFETSRTLMARQVAVVDETLDAAPRFADRSPRAAAAWRDRETVNPVAALQRAEAWRLTWKVDPPSSSAANIQNMYAAGRRTADPASTGSAAPNKRSAY